MSEPSKYTPEVTTFWESFVQKQDQLAPDTHYEVWYFGDSEGLAYELASLVVSGKKTATASLFWEYEIEGEAVPQVNDYSVITNYGGEPRGVIQTIELRVLPFDEVDSDFAADEGEGDLSLDYWRQAHWQFFSRTCTRLGLVPNQKMPVVCERFRLLFAGI